MFKYYVEAISWGETKQEPTRYKINSEVAGLIFSKIADHYKFLSVNFEEFIKSNVGKLGSMGISTDLVIEFNNNDKQPIIYEIPQCIGDPLVWELEGNNK